MECYLCVDKDKDLRASPYQTRVTLGNNINENHMPDSAKSLRTIVVGAKSPYCTSVRWSDVTQKNFVDYDVAILIVRDLSDGAMMLNGPLLSQMQNQLLRLVGSGGQLIVVTPGQYPFTTRHSDQNAAVIKSNLGAILPIPVSFRSESGHTVTRIDDKPYVRYLRHVKKWDFWASITGQGSVEGPFLSNREGRTIAGFFAVGPNGLTILPDVDELTPDEIALEILTELGFQETEVPPPDWVQSISVPGLAEIGTAMADCRSQIQEATVRLQKHEDEWRAIDKYRKLLYSTGDDLENIVDQVLTDLGAIVSEERHGVEDSLVTMGGSTCVVEVTGTDATLKLLKVRQLLDHAMLVEEKTGTRPKAILVANALRTLAPSDRDGADPPEYPSNVLERMKESKSALVPSRWLFEKYCEVLAGKTDKATIIAEILGANGLIA